MLLLNPTPTVAKTFNTSNIDNVIINSNLPRINVNVCIGDIPLSNYMPKYIKQIININNMTCGFETCISAILLQSDLNKWRLSILSRLDKLYINYASTILLQRSNTKYIEYNNQIFPNNSDIHLRACDSASSYHFTFPVTRAKIPKWECILTCCFDCPRTNDP